MKIAIDISQIVHKGTGVARFTHGLVTQILQSKSHDWTFFFSSLRNKLDPPIASGIKKRGRLFEYSLPPTLLSFLWNTTHTLQFEKLVGNVDWVITSDWTEPPSQAKKATIVHDVAFLRYPETVPAKIRTTQKKRLSWVKKESSIIFADSHATQSDLVECLGFDKKRIIVNYPGVEVMKVNKDIIEKTKKKYALTKPFILTVGKIEPRKNLPRLIEAFTDLRDISVELIIAGPSGWDTVKTENKSVHFLGLIEDEELAALYSSCTAFVYPSLWEGFGYPVLEAMKYGTPVATSKTSSLGEMSGGAALLFDPLSTAEIRKSLHTLISDEKLREELSEKGKKQAAGFAWEKYYKKMILSLENN